MISYTVSKRNKSIESRQWLLRPRVELEIRTDCTGYRASSRKD